MIIDEVFALAPATLVVLAVHVAACVALVGAIRRRWTGVAAVFAGLVFQLPLLILELGNLALSGDALLEHEGRPVVTLLLAPLALLMWWFGRRGAEAAAQATVGLRGLPSLPARQGLKVLFSGVAVLLAILLVTLSILWCLVLAQALFGGVPLTFAAVWAITAKAFVTAAPAFGAAAVVSIFVAILVFAVTMARRRDP